MVPNGVIGVLFLVAALSPGLLFHRAVMRYEPRDSRSTVVEVVEFTTVGALTTVAACVLALLAGEVVPGLVTLGEVVGAPAALRARPWGVVGSSALVLLLSFALALGAGRVWTRRSAARSSRIREGSAWAGVLAGKRDGKPAYLSVELDDGRLVEGVFRSVSVAEEPARDALALRRPIRVAQPGSAERTDLDEDFVLIPRSIVKAVHGSYKLTKAPDVQADTEKADTEKADTEKAED
jgi:hypothetical protein